MGTWGQGVGRQGYAGATRSKSARLLRPYLAPTGVTTFSHPKDHSGLRTPLSAAPQAPTSMTVLHAAAEVSF